MLPAYTVLFATAGDEVNTPHASGIVCAAAAPMSEAGSRSRQREPLPVNIECLSKHL